MADFVAGSASIRISPDLLGFHRKVKQTLRAERIEAPIPITPDMTKFAERLEFQLKKVRANLKVKISPDLSRFARDMRAELRTAGQNGGLEAPLRLDFTQAREQLRLFRIEAGAPISVRMDIDTSGALAQLAALRTAARGVVETMDGVGGNGSATRNALSGLTGGPMRRIRMQVEIDRASVARAEAEVAAVAQRLSGAQRQQADAIDRVSVAQARMNEVSAQANATDSQRLHAQTSLARAQRDLADRTARVTSLFGDQTDAHRRLGTAQRQQGSASNIVMAGLGGMAEMSRNVGTKLTSIISPASAATSALLALAAVNIVPLIGQFAQAAGVISLLPAVAAAAAAGIATIVIGSKGIMDAFKAGSKAADDAAKNGAKAAKEAAANAKAQANAQKAVAQAARGVENAQDGVARAERGVQTAQKASERAQKDLTRARKDAKEQIEDLNLSLKGSALDERSAVLAVQRAEQRLRELGKDGTPVASLDLSEAVLGVDEAKQRLDEVRERNGDLKDETEAANKAGIEGSEQVVSAKEKVADADQGVVDAQKAVLDSQQSLLDAQQNLTDAQVAAAEATSSSADAVDEYADALANLSPNARKFVEDTRSLGAAWKDLRLQVQDNLFADLGTSLTNFANFALPTLKTGLSGIATEINGGIQRALADLNTESTKLDWTKILENTRAAIGPVIDGLSNLWGSLTNIAAIGSEFLPGFGKSFSDVMSEFRAWTESPDGQNKIRDFMKDSIQALSEVKDLFVAVGRVVGGLFSTSEKNGKSMFQSMTDGLNKFADWMDTPVGAERMQKFWDDAQQTAKDLLMLVGQAIQLAEKLSKLSNNSFGLLQPRSEEGPTVLDPQGNDGGSTGFGTRPPEDRPSPGMKPGGFDDSPGGKVIVDAFGGRDSWERFIDGFTEGGYDKKLGMLQSFGAFAQNMIPGLTQAKALGGEVVEQFGVVKDKTVELGQAFVDEVSVRASAAWTTLSDKVSTTWNTNISPAIEAFKRDGLTGLANHFVETITNGSVLTWQELPAAIGAGVAEMAEKHFPGLTNALSGVRDFFGTIVDGIATKWGELKAAAAEPINWIIDTVINGSLKNAWNAVAGVIPGLKTWDGVANIDVANTGAGKGGFDKGVAGYYTGGIIPGYTPGKDTTVIGVGGGEAVMRPEWTRAMGADYVHQMNAAARQGGVDGVKQRMQYFNQGGIVESMTSAVQEKFPGMQMTSGLRFTDNGYHSKGMAADFSDGTASTPAMRQLAGWIADNFANRTIELIHDPFDRNIGAGNPVGDGYGFYGAGTMAEHNNHVHWAADGLLGGGGAVGSADGGGILGGAKRVLGGAVNSARRAAASAFEQAASAIGSNIPDFGPSMMGQLPKSAFNGIKDAMTAAIRGANSSSSGSTDAGNTPFDLSAGVEQWRGRVIEALKREGFDPSERNQQLMLAQMQTESGGNPNIVQGVQDVNSGGNEAVGLMQVIPGTFATYRNPDLPNDRTNPDASLSAALRWYRARYGEDLGQMWGQGHGYANGGIIPGYTPGTDKYQIAVGGGEAVMRPEWTRGVGKPYVDNMNYIARTQGVDGVRKAARFAVGGVVDPNKFLLDRLGKFGSQVGDIAKSAIPEILGVQGTVLDPNHRYWQAAMDIQSAVQSSQAVAPGSNLQNIPAPLNGGPTPAPMPGTGNEFHFHVSDVESALQKTQLMLKQQQLAFTRR